MNLKYFISQRLLKIRAARSYGSQKANNISLCKTLLGSYIIESYLRSRGPVTISGNSNDNDSPSHNNNNQHDEDDDSPDKDVEAHHHDDHGSSKEEWKADIGKEEGTDKRKELQCPRHPRGAATF
jgi:hypothetical protein